MKRGLCLVVLGLILAAAVAPAGAQQEFRFGFQAGFTGGPGAVYGAFARRAVEMAVDEINAKGGVNGLRLVPVTVDDQMNPTVAVNVIKKFISVDKLPLVLGSNTNTALAIIPIADQSKTVFMTAMSVHPDIAKMSPWSFRMALDFLKASDKAIEYLHHKGARKLGLLVFNHESTRRIAENVRKSFEALGGTVVVEEILPRSPDFRSTIDKVRAAEPDAIYISSFVSESAKVLKQMAERGWKPKVGVAADSLEDPKFFEQVGDAAEGAVYGGLASDPKVYGEFAERYRKRYSEEPEVFGAQYYDSVYLIAEAVRRGGTTAEGIQKGLLAIQHYKGVCGDISFDKEGDVQLPIGLKGIKGQKYVFINGVRP
jgi:branched-chain amino acid transport system substrate-binding protein